MIYPMRKLEIGESLREPVGVDGRHLRDSAKGYKRRNPGWDYISRTVAGFVVVTRVDPNDETVDRSWELVFGSGVRIKHSNVSDALTADRYRTRRLNQNVTET